MVRRWVVVAVAGFAGCESVRNPTPVPVDPAPVVAQQKNPSPQPPPPGGEGEKAPAVALSPPSFSGKGAGGLGLEPADDALTLAADCLARGDRPAAAAHLETYVRAHPDQLMFRAQLAELLVKADRDDAAKVHFERFADDARTATGPPKDHLVHVHTRLMEIGQRAGDRGAELFHRGVGLLILVEEQDVAPDRDEAFCEGMLCQALKALAEAKELNPGDVRVRAHLAEVYDRLGSRRAADAERAAVRESVVPVGMPALP